MVKIVTIKMFVQQNDDLLKILIGCEWSTLNPNHQHERKLEMWICRITSYQCRCKWSIIVFMVLAGKHFIGIRTSGSVCARRAHQHSRFRATTSPSTSWQTLWQHGNSSLWHCHSDFHAIYQHLLHDVITVLRSKYHFNIGWPNITSNI